MLYLAYLTHVSLIYSEAQSLVPRVGEKKVWVGSPSRSKAP